MKRGQAIAGSALFLVIAPGTMAGLLPWLIGRWTLHPEPFWLRITGVVLIVTGLPVLIDSFARFAMQGFGTPAPLAPTQHLVVTGAYCYVRNPMYLSVAALVFGQAVLLGDWRIALYGAVFALVCHLFVVLVEEPRLMRDFGADYVTYRDEVPRWIPRLTPWPAP